MWTVVSDKMSTTLICNEEDASATSWLRIVERSLQIFSNMKMMQTEGNANTIKNHPLPCLE